MLYFEVAADDPVAGMPWLPSQPSKSICQHHLLKVAMVNGMD